MKSQGQFEPQRRARRRALQALYQWHLTRQQADDIINQFLEEQDFSKVDFKMFDNLVREVISSHEALDEALAPYLSRPMLQLDIMETVILRMAAHELLHQPQVPYRVVLDEAIELALRFGAEQGHSFINGVLDKAVRDWRKTELAIDSPRPG